MIGCSIADQNGLSANPNLSLADNTIANGNTQNAPAIQGKNAVGENQTTVVDQNGNLKMIEGAPSVNTNMRMRSNSSNDNNIQSTVNSSTPPVGQKPANMPPNMSSAPVPMTSNGGGSIPGGGNSSVPTKATTDMPANNTPAHAP